MSHLLQRGKGEQTVFPVTIKQINDAFTGDDQVKIDGRDVNQVFFLSRLIKLNEICMFPRAPAHPSVCSFSKVVIVGTVLTIDAQALAINYSMDDGTGRIDVRWWSDPENGGEAADEKRSMIR